MAAPDKVLELIERFDYNLKDYRSGNYNETRVRREFIDPFFKALGWDIDNEKNRAEAYKQVIHEDTIKIGGKTKAPDYSFRIGGTRKFFLEAKKPSVNIKDDLPPAFQIRRYAWSAKLPLSILTDFEELAVYDCRIQPNPSDKASTARIKYLKFHEYAEQWDYLEGNFSPDAIERGSFDKYASDTKNKKGTAEVDDAFLQEIEGWRELLAKNIALRNPTLTQRHLNVAVQKTIDRIIFLRICEDRGIEPYNTLGDLEKGANVYNRLGDIFQRADDRYNSGLFHFKQERNRPEEPDSFTLDLTIDDKPLKEILKGLYYPNSPYEFSVLPADILGQVYEQFLGKVIVLDAKHRAMVEEKPEVKKAGGVYYTPTYIVDYIVQNTVGKLLEGKTPNQISTQGKTPPLRVLDPACGSGSFLIGAYQYLLDWHLTWYRENDPEKYAKGRSPRLYQGKAQNWRLTTDERKRILLTHIYGVDIDTQAVEVTKLSLLLKMLEGENNDSLVTQTALFQARVLPDLENNIKSGNSLIGSDFYNTKQTSMFDTEERYRINTFDWKEEGFPRIFLDGGFDAVIGNPPYGATIYEDEKKYLAKTYRHQSYQLDSYLVFLEKSISELLKLGGHYGMIIPNPWLTNLLQGTLRHFIVENSAVTNITHFKYSVFKKVTVDTQVVLLQKAEKTKVQPAIYVMAKKPMDNDWKASSAQVITHDQELWRELQGEPINIFLSEEAIALAKRCREIGSPLGTLLKINVGIKPYQTGKGNPPQTKEIVKARPFDSTFQKDDSYRLYLRGKDIARYTIKPIEERFIKYGTWLAEPRPAANFEAPIKIFMRQTGDSLVGALDTSQYLCLNNMHVLVPENFSGDMRYLLGIINSKLMNWFYQTLNPEVGEALAEVKKTNVAKLPIKILDLSVPGEEDTHDSLVQQVETMQNLNKQFQTSKTAQDRKFLERQIKATDRHIDQIIYKQIYDLTPEEIALIEDK